MGALNLAIVRQRYTPFGGAERFVELAIEALADAGVEVVVYTREWPAAAAARVTPVVVDPPYWGSVWRDWSFARAVCERLAPAPDRLVQSHERIACCDVYRAGDGVHQVWLERRAASCTPLERLGLVLNPYHRYTLAAERRLFASPRLLAVICNSRMVADEIRSRFAVSGDRLHVIHSAVDGRRFSPDAAAAHRGEVRARLGIASDVPLFLLVGSGYRRKGVEFAIAAVARSAGCHLAVVGREPRLHRYVAIARRASVADRVHFAGPQADPLPWYGAADAFVLPTLYDPLPNAALEAMACALPVVTSEGCGAAELVRRWDCGRVCAADDVPALASHLEALRDPGLRRDMGLRARRGAATLQPEVMARQLVALYRSLLPAPQVGTEAVGSL